LIDQSEVRQKDLHLVSHHRLEFATKLAQCYFDRL